MSRLGDPSKRLLDWYLHSASLPARLTRTVYRVGKVRYQTLRSIPWHRRFRKNLLLLHDVLATTEMAGKYWVCGGLLVGWAREGRVIQYDRDADFGLLTADRATFLEVIPRILAAGFSPLHRWTNNGGEATEYCFLKDGTKFEFFVFDPTDEGFVSFVYYTATECRCVVPAHGLAPMPFLGRTWQKPDDHEAYLTAVYGDWRVPNPYYYYVDDEKDIRERYPWHGTHVWPPGVDGAP
jgi:hypothetical protein